MSRIESEIASFEISAERARGLVQDGESAIALYNNPAFNKLIVEGYFKEEASRLVHLYSSATINESQRENIQRDMHAIGALRQYLHLKVKMGDMAKAELHDIGEGVDELRGLDAAEAEAYENS